MSPRSREKYVTDNSKGVHKTGKANTGKVGSGGYFDGGNGGGQRGPGGTSPLTLIILVLALVFGGGGGLFSSISSNQMPSTTTTNLNGASGITKGWRLGNNTGTLNTSIDSGARKKYTALKGGGRDEMTLMVYMCGTDLESRSGMATSDLNEMLKATTGNKLHILVYTGGCARWRNSTISNSYNQIYSIENGRFVTKVNNDGSKPMTSPSTLTGFISWCNKNYNANRKGLIMWDHGGGSISGYGYDEKYRNSGTMTLNNLDKALKAANTKFDFIGFDACLMATVENALMLNKYADYLIASEETEPGIGWYYTNWVTQLGKNTSMSTLDLGKLIADEFVAKCQSQCAGQLTTLSVTDLAELAATIPDCFTSFAKSTRQLMANNDYRVVSSARNTAREFSRTAIVDQIDLADFATIIGEQAGKDLSSAILNAVKYNKTSSNMTNAYGLSVYFPYSKANKVDTMVSTYKAIGMDEDYTRCIQEFAKIEVTGQAATQHQSSPVPSLFGNYSSQSTVSSADVIETLLQGFLTGNYGSLSGFSSGNSSFLTGRSIDDEAIASYVADNQFDTSELEWNGSSMKLSKSNWEKVQGLDLNMFYDDGEGYIDLGLDNLYDLDGRTLKASTDRTWLAINGQPVAYYHVQTVDNGDDDYTIMGRVPCRLNGTLVDLILIFDQDNPHGFIAGARINYGKKVDTQARGLIKLQKGDKLKFLCDYYTYDGQYEDTYYLGETMTVTSKMEISNVDVGKGDVLITYRFTDLYNNHFWTPTLTLEK